jgi:hypothetical protein
MSRKMAVQNSFSLADRVAPPKRLGLLLEAFTSSGYTPKNNHGGYWQRRSLKDDFASHARKYCRSVWLRNQWRLFRDLDDPGPWIFKLASAG